MGITKTIKHFKPVLYGQDINVYTDHKNLTYDTSDYARDRALRQRHTLEKYGAKLIYIKGELNVMADALSRLPLKTTIKLT